MSLFGSVAKLARGAIKTASSVSKIPVLGSLAKAVPFVGTALTAADLASNLLGSGGGGGGLPALPGGSGAGLPALPGTGAPAIVGKRGVFRNDANVPEALKPMTISKPDLRMVYRSPIKGYVVLHDSNGDPFAIPKKVAQMYHLWKPHKKPPISVGEMTALKKSKRVIHKVRKIHGLIKYVHDNTSAHGQVLIHKHTKKGGHAK